MKFKDTSTIFDCPIQNALRKKKRSQSLLNLIFICRNFKRKSTGTSQCFFRIEIQKYEGCPKSSQTIAFLSFEMGLYMHINIVFQNIYNKIPNLMKVVMNVFIKIKPKFYCMKVSKNGPVSKFPNFEILINNNYGKQKENKICKVKN